MTALAIQISPTMRTTSMQVAKVFRKQHAHILRAVEALQADMLGDASTDGAIFTKISYVDSMNRQQTGIEMTRDGFSLLAMGFLGREALQWKLKFLAAFNDMEATILKNNDKLEWKAARLQIKAVRATFVTSVKDFVDYATAQGSTSAHRYYGNLTKMEYSALGLLDQQKSALGNFRETLDIIDLGYLGVAEITAKAALEYGMQQKMHYKEIYQYAKQKVTEYANAVSVPRVN